MLMNAITYAELFTNFKEGRNKHMNQKTVCVVGLGYVGLPLYFCGK